MRWLKHYSNSLNSESLSDLIRNSGFQGYGRYWVLLEHLAGLFDGETVSFRIPVENIRSLLRVRSWKELDTVCDQLTTVSGLKIKRNENVFEIESPILLDLLGRDFRTARQARAKPAPKNKKEIKNNIIHQKAPPAVIFDFEKIIEIYPRKEGKSAAFKKLAKDIKTQTDYDNLKKSVQNYGAKIRLDRTELRFTLKFSNFVDDWRDYINNSTAAPLSSNKQVKEIDSRIEQFNSSYEKSSAAKNGALALSDLNFVVKELPK